MGIRGWDDLRARARGDDEREPVEIGRDMGESYTERYRDRGRDYERESELEREGRFARGEGDTRWGTGGMPMSEDRPARRARERPPPPRPPEPVPAHAPGPFVGLGPRGYRRSDERIHEDACDRLTDHGWIDASDVVVEVAAGEVTLGGTVASRAAKRLAEDLVESVSGVVEVHNRLRIRRDESRVEEGEDRPARPPALPGIEAPRRADDLPTR